MTDTSTDETEQGLYPKYEVFKNGEPVEDCFVLKPRSDTAAREALIRYAEETDNDELADGLREWVTAICTRGSNEEDEQCHVCNGSGTITRRYGTDAPGPAKITKERTCFWCDGSGVAPDKSSTENQQEGSR
jgi:hypothetical protein